jgi:hypothetical protein
MMLRKLVMFTSAAAAFVALAAPVAAQATGPKISGTEAFEGYIHFEVKLGPAAGSTFGCEVTVTASGEAVSTTTANITRFDHTTESCTGTGIFTDCTLKEDFTNVPWVAHSGTDHTLIVTKPNDDITFKYVYDGPGCPVAGLHIEFGSVKATPDPTEGAISTLAFAGANTGSSVTLKGTVHAEGSHSGLSLTT